MFAAYIYRGMAGGLSSIGRHRVVASANDLECWSAEIFPICVLFSNGGRSHSHDKIDSTAMYCLVIGLLSPFTYWPCTFHKFLSLSVFVDPHCSAKLILERPANLATDNAGAEQFDRFKEKIQ